MNEKIPRDGATLDEVAAVLKALGEPNRLRILDELMKGDTCNAELNEALGLSPNLLSHHLRVLSDVGLITSRRDRIDGRWIYYTVDPDAVARWQHWFSAFLDPDRIQVREVCGPERELAASDRITLSEPLTENSD
ncbi:MAG TPA: metalloregulator ArsR/SmtB family transcription factor [Candidatus Sulfomarinibacteraceae bacterium]|nr:metalloregulator ArsR/SmtB family transcription factor [Candidatus Sulfomarinibacteraceae bacterium]